MSNHEITASFNDLMRDASSAAYSYLVEANNMIDDLYGKGYAKNHPELVGAFIQAAAIDLAAVTIAVKLQEISKQLEIGINVDVTQTEL